MSTLIEEMPDVRCTVLNPPWSEWLADADLLRLTQHPLLAALGEGRADARMLKGLLVQHHHYSRHFTRYLVAVISKLDRLDDMRSLTANLLEEMGVDCAGKVTHAELYQRTLRAVGAVPDMQPALPETQALVRAMMSYCRDDDLLAGLAALCLGAEAIVPLVYRPILRALAAAGHDADATEFFRVHIEEDEMHAMTMLSIMRRLTQDDPDARRCAMRIGVDMIHRRAAMFDAIWECSGIDDALSPPAPAPDVVAGDPAPARRFSSADFWQVPAKLKAAIPERLHHKDVINDQAGGSGRFSSERNHRVHIVDLPSCTISMTIGRLEPGEQTRSHRHNYETMIYVTAGKGFSRIGNRIVEWSAGDAFYVPVWSAHQHVSTSDGECVYVACENAPLLQNLGGIALREELDPRSTQSTFS
jgi:pyrroloquinoline-quinone synthase